MRLEAGLVRVTDAPGGGLLGWYDGGAQAARARASSWRRHRVKGRTRSTPRTATGSPPRRYTARKLRSPTSPSSTVTSSARSAAPANWMRAPYWSDQKYGGRGGPPVAPRASALGPAAGGGASAPRHRP